VCGGGCSVCVCSSECSSSFFWLRPLIELCECF
jgi:hypothetical protein